MSEEFKRLREIAKDRPEILAWIDEQEARRDMRKIMGKAVPYKPLIKPLYVGFEISDSIEGKLISWKCPYNRKPIDKHLIVELPTKKNRITRTQGACGFLWDCPIGTIVHKYDKERTGFVKIFLEYEPSFKENVSYEVIATIVCFPDLESHRFAEAFGKFIIEEDEDEIKKT